MIYSTQKGIYKKSAYIGKRKPDIWQQDVQKEQGPRSTDISETQKSVRKHAKMTGHDHFE